MKETAKWSKFLSIIGFIGSGLMVIIGLFASAVMSSMFNTYGSGAGGFSSITFGIMYVLMGALYFVPSLYLYNYSNKMKLALATSNAVELEEAFLNQKSLFKFWGVLTIVIISFYLLFAIFGLLAFMMM